jgi:hypothetical protein
MVSTSALHLVALRHRGASQRVGPWLFLLALVLLVSLSLGCERSNPSAPTAPTAPSELTDQQKHEIARDLTSTDSLAVLAFSDADPDSGLQHLMTAASRLPTVESASIEDCVLSIKFRNGGSVTWDARGAPEAEVAEAPSVSPSLNRESAGRLGSRDLVGNSSVIIANPMSLDLAQQPFQPRLIDLAAEFDARGYTASRSIVSGSACDRAWFSSALAGHGAVVINAHGYYRPRDGRTWIVTGELAPPNLEQLLSPAWVLPWVRGEVEVFTDATCGRKGQPARKWIGISDLFISKMYPPGTMPNSLVLLTSCSVFKDPAAELPAAFRRAGAAAVVGWDDVVEAGVSVGSLTTLIKLMLMGDDLRTAHERLAPPLLKWDVRSVKQKRTCPAAKDWTVGLKYLGAGALSLVDGTGHIKVEFTPDPVPDWHSIPPSGTVFDVDFDPNSLMYVRSGEGLVSLRTRHIVDAFDGRYRVRSSTEYLMQLKNGVLQVPNTSVELITDLEHAVAYPNSEGVRSIYLEFPNSNPTLTFGDRAVSISSGAREWYNAWSDELQALVPVNWHGSVKVTITPGMLPPK